MGVLLLAAHAHLRSLLLSRPAPPSGTFADALPRLLLLRLPGGGHGDALPGLSQAGGRAAALLCGTLLAGASALWSGMVGAHPTCGPDLVAATP